MNKANLQQIFSNYIEKFELINSKEHDENYKWVIAQKFPDLINEALNSDTNEFADRLLDVKKWTSNLIDAGLQPFGGLCEFAKQDPEAVREMFINLYKEDKGDLKLRQTKISTFIKESEGLLEKYRPGGWRYANDQRSVMAYLFFNDPDNHYLYKAYPAGIFADCVEFYDNWGPMTDFSIEIYYRMCDELVAHIRQCPELLETNESRFTGADKPMFPDKSYHILAFDIIYCAAPNTYNLYEGINFSRPDSKTKLLHNERREKAANYLTEMDMAQKEMDALTEALRYFSSLLNLDMEIHHKVFGTGKITEISEQKITVLFQVEELPKKFIFPRAAVDGLLQIDAPEFTEKVKLYRSVIIQEREIKERLQRAKTAFEVYKEWL